MADLYEDLGVSKDATQQEIKKAYKGKAHRHHPDKGGDSETFHAVAFAYSVLSDPKRREKYDKDGTTEKQKGPEFHAEKVIHMWINEILEQDTLPRDFVQELVDRVSSGRDQLSKAQNQTNFRIKKFKKLLGRVTSESPGHTIFDNALEKKIRDCEQQLKQIEEQLEISKAMEAIIENYNDTEERDAPVIFTGDSDTTFSRMSSSDFRRSGLWK